MIAFIRQMASSLLRARIFVFVVIPLYVAVVAMTCRAEVYCLELLFRQSSEPLMFAGILSLVHLTLLLLCFLLSVLCLHLTESAQKAGLAETALFVLFAGSYAFWARGFPLQPILYLGAGKVLVTILLARFWHAKFREFRMRFRDVPTARFFAASKSRFLCCIWVVVGGWLIAVLAFSLALAESQQLLQLEGWEGFSLLFTFFGLFWLFVRNPNAHSELSAGA